MHIVLCVVMGNWFRQTRLIDKDVYFLDPNKAESQR